MNLFQAVLFLNLSFPASARSSTVRGADSSTTAGQLLTSEKHREKGSKPSVHRRAKKGEDVDGSDSDYDFITESGKCEVCSKAYKNKPVKLTLQFNPEGVNSEFQTEDKASCRAGTYPTGTSLVVENKSGNFLAEITAIQEGDIIEFTGSGNNYDLMTNFDSITSFVFGDGTECFIHTSCSVPIVTGDQIGPFIVLGGIGYWSECAIDISAPPSLFPSSAPSTRPPSLSPSSFPSQSPSRLSSTLPSVYPSMHPSTSPSSSPSFASSSSPSFAPSSSPSFVPSSSPSFAPSSSPSFVPSSSPSFAPSSSPSFAPIFSPSTSPPSSVPSDTPSSLPSLSPTQVVLVEVITGPPTSAPSASPSTVMPSVVPSNPPSLSLSQLPSTAPTASPSTTPSTTPPVSHEPSSARPSFSPSVTPSTQPSRTPSMNPSSSPTYDPLCPNTELSLLDEVQDFENGRWEGWSNGKVDQSGSDFTSFLGRYDQNDEGNFPSKEYEVPDPSTVRFYLQFDFYEIGSWDGDGHIDAIDSFGLQISSDIEETFSLGWFKNFAYLNQMSENGGSGKTEKGIEWSFTSMSPSDSPQGFKDAENPHWDQKHTFLVEIPRHFFESSRKLSVTFQWSLSGNMDESVGIDNIRTVSCIDLVPSAAPSSIPSMAPSDSPTRPPVPAPRPAPRPAPAPPTCDDDFLEGAGCN